MTNILIKFLWILACIIDISYAESNACSICSCKNNNLDCSTRNLGNHLNDTDLEGLKYDQVIFDHNVIVHLKPFPVMTAKKLSFRYNGITVIDVATFREVKNLTEIDLSHNHLTSHTLLPHCFMGNYSPEAYEPLQFMKILRLSGNSLHTLHPDLFEHLPNLRELSLDSNPLKIIDRPTSIAIASLLQLQVLDLSSVSINKLPATLLHTPRFLETLNLSSNSFKTVPVSLGEGEESLQTLVLDNNPISEIDFFPALNNLEVLHLNYMPNLRQIGSGALKNLPRLKELVISYNPQLEYIAEDALIGNDMDWPPLKKLYLNHNKLAYLGQDFLARWDHLNELDISMNPWSCDCDNQWFLSTLIPQFLILNQNKAQYMMCEEPVEMRGRLFVNLSISGVEMRCLDTRGSQPEKDAFILVMVVLSLLFIVPIVMALFAIYHKVYRNVTPMVRLSYRRATFTDNVS